MNGCQQNRMICFPEGNINCYLFNNHSKGICELSIISFSIRIHSNGIFELYLIWSFTSFSKCMHLNNICFFWIMDSIQSYTSSVFQILAWSIQRSLIALVSNWLLTLICFNLSTLTAKKVEPVSHS